MAGLLRIRSSRRLVLVTGAEIRKNVCRSSASADVEHDFRCGALCVRRRCRQAAGHPGPQSVGLAPFSTEAIFMKAAPSQNSTGVPATPDPQRGKLSGLSRR